MRSERNASLENATVMTVIERDRTKIWCRGHKFRQLRAWWPAAAGQQNAYNQNCVLALSSRRTYSRVNAQSSEIGENKQSIALRSA